MEQYFLKLRKRKTDLRPSEVAKLINRSPSLISEIEANKRAPGRKLCSDLAKVYKCKIETVISYADKIEDYLKAQKESKKLTLKNGRLG